MPRPRLSRATRHVLTERERCGRALAALGDPDADLARALADKEAAVRASGEAAGNRLAQLAQAFGARRAEAREVDEALRAGSAAQAAATRLAKPVGRLDGPVGGRDGQVSRRGGQG